MTEHEWLNCSNPEPLLNFVGAAASDRKLRLFACACCRRIWHLLDEELGQAAVEIADLFADGLATVEELESARQAAFEGVVNLADDEFDFELYDESLESGSLWQAARAAHLSCSQPSWLFRAFRSSAQAVWCEVFENKYNTLIADETRNAEYAAQVRLFLDLFGNPFHPVTLDPRWLTSTVVDLAEALYQEGAFERLPILADALMDAGCDNEEIIAHCRADEPHVRGCWVVDLLTSKG